MITGIVSGLVATAIVYVYTFLSKEVIFPRLRDVRYQGFRVGGVWKWEGKKNGGDSDVVTLALKQSAEEVTGTMNTLWVRGGKSTTTIHNFKGYIMDGVLLGTCAPAANSTVSHLSIFATATDTISGPKLRLRKTAIDFSTKAISHDEFDLEKNT